MSKKYIIFDFDGTLCNTNDIIVESWQAAFEHYLGHRVPRREIEATFGEILVHTIGQKIPDAPVQEVVDYYRAYQDANQQGQVHVFDGIRELLTELRARGCKIGVATSRTAYSFWNYMKQFGLENAVDEVVTMNDVTKHKPHPESITAVLSKLTGLAQDELTEEILEQSVMVGDTKYDVGCANNAHVDSVIVDYSHYIDEEDMAASGFVPTYRIDTPGQLLELI
ncbi:MAG: HAD family hydrolase [Mogibacterium sp.]|nr:HAD family hydrolase [Mogibacterium sp.]